jgi:3-isopropylmalate/(R)-2-methylmalate dehydratase small subunit
MQRFTCHTGVAVPLGLANVDTDQLIPARFMKRPREQGYGQFLLHDLRFAPDGAANAGFVLNDPRHAGASILVAGRNFGTGSSREAAVYALWDYGIRCVIAPSFGDIFASNAVKNGLLPAVLAEADVSLLLATLSAQPGAVTVDLEACHVRCGADVLAFDIDPVRRLQLLNGWDDLDLTRRHTDEIARYRARHLMPESWRWPRLASGPR